MVHIDDQYFIMIDLFTKITILLTAVVKLVKSVVKKHI